MKSEMQPTNSINNGIVNSSESLDNTMANSNQVNPDDFFSIEEDVISVPVENNVTELCDTKLHYVDKVEPSPNSNQIKSCSVEKISYDINSAKTRLEQLPNNLGANLQNLCEVYGSEFVVKDFILCFFRVLFPEGNPCNNRDYWFHAICYEKIAKYIGAEFNINVGEFNSTNGNLIVTTPLSIYIDHLLEISQRGNYSQTGELTIEPSNAKSHSVSRTSSEVDDHFDNLYTDILNGFQTLSDILQIRNDNRYKSVVTVIKELTGSVPNYLLPGQQPNKSKDIPTQVQFGLASKSISIPPSKNVSNTRGNNLHLDNHSPKSQQQDNKNYKKGGFQNNTKSFPGNRSPPEYKTISNSDTKAESLSPKSIDTVKFVENKSNSTDQNDKSLDNSSQDKVKSVKSVKSKSNPIDKVKFIGPVSNSTTLIDSDKSSIDSDKLILDSDQQGVYEKPNRSNQYGKSNQPNKYDKYSPKKKSDRLPINKSNYSNIDHPNQGGYLDSFNPPPYLYQDNNFQRGGFLPHSKLKPLEKYPQKSNSKK